MAHSGKDPWEPGRGGLLENASPTSSYSGRNANADVEDQAAAPEKRASTASQRMALEITEAEGERRASTKSDRDRKAEVARPAAPRGPRLHHLDWLRSIMIGLAVYLHVWQVLTETSFGVRLDNTAFPIFPKSWAEYTTLNQGNPNYQRNSYEWRYITLGRQFCIPMLFFINGAAMAFNKGSMLPVLGKIGFITVLGMASNAGIWFIGPRNDTCKFSDAPNMAECNKGSLINWVVAPRAGSLFAVLFQFWFTLFVLVFIAEDTFLYRACQAVLAASGGGAAGAQAERSSSVRRWGSEVTCEEPRESVARPLGLCAVRCLFVGALYFGLLLGWVHKDADDGLAVWAAFIACMEVLFTCCLLMSARTSAEKPTLVRLWQYLAAAVAVVQFTVPDLNLDATQYPQGFDGRIVTYFHIFKHMSALGFVVALTRDKAGPVLSRAWPLALILLVACCPSTNFFSAGQATYPWFPFRTDRVLYSLGSFVILFACDRIGRTFAAAGMCEPLPGCVGLGSLLAFLFHPWGIVLLVSVRALQGANPAIVTSILLTIFVALGGVYELVAACLCRKPRRPPP